MRVPDNALVTRKGWPAGIDNRSKETAIPDDALREAVNVDLHAGKVGRRNGRTLAQAGVPRSLWRSGDMPFALYAEAGVLNGWYGPGQSFAIGAGLSTRDLSYALVNDRVYWTDGYRNGCVLMDGTGIELGCPNPAHQPALTAHATVGGLHAGKYQVAITFLAASGEESGTGLAATVEVPEGGGISLSNVPTAPASVAMVRVYVSHADGDTLYYATDLAPGQTNALIGVHTPGKPLATQFLEAMPAGHTIRWLNGRLYVADGEAIYWSEALRYGLTKLTHNRLGLSPPAMMEPLGAGTEGAGMLVADAKRTYWLAGTDPARWSQKIVYAHGAVPGTAILVPGSMFGMETTAEVLYFFATNGVGMLALPGGALIPQREAQTTAPAADAGISVLDERDGHRRVVTALHGTRKRGLAVADSMTVTVHRHDQ